MSISCRRVFAVLAFSLLSLGARSQPSVNALRAPAGAAPAEAVKGFTPDSLTIAYSQYLWPKTANGVAKVFYVIDAASDPNATSKIGAAVAIFNADFRNIIQWAPWRASQGPNYVDINLNANDTSGVCEADEGYEAKPAQPMTGSTACTIGTLLHEMGHVIGLWHEQSRPDRDTYITINYNNVIKGSWSNFQVATDNEQILAPYDYASVMQYIPYAFTRNGRAVIESIPAGIPLAGYAGVPAHGTSGTPAMPTFDYSAADKETIKRLYGAAPKQVTVTSNPEQLNVIVDGVTITTPQTFAWPLYSTHTLDVPAGGQTLSGDILNSDPPAPTTFYYVYGRWNDSTAQAHTITVIPGSGSTPFPTTAPQIATYSANFIQVVPYSAAILPAGTGGTTVSPQPQTYSGLTGQFFTARQQVALKATVAAGWNFYEFNNAPVGLPGGLGANPKTFDVPDSGNPVNVTTEFSNTPVYTVDVQPATFSSNLYAYVDSQFTATPRNFSAFYPSDSSWTPGSTHTLNLDAAEQPYSFNSRYSFLNWSDGGALSHSIVSLPATSTKYVATVTPEFRPATNFDYPPCGGAALLSPTSNDGFYPAGQQLQFSAAPGTGWSFAGWTYDRTGTANPATLTANGETLVFANFNTVATPLTLASITPSAARAGGSAFTLTLTGTGFSPGSLVSANKQFRTVTFVSSKTLKVPMSAADIASPGAFQVNVENFPSGSSGCAVFGYQTFLVTGKGPPTATPVFSPAAGSYSTQQMVSINDAVSGAKIYYTTDGSTPTTSSPVYGGSITVSSTQTLKAFATAAGYVRSVAASATYTINPPAAMH